MGESLQIDLAQTAAAAQALRTAAQDAVAAGSTFLDAGATVTGSVEAGTSIAPSLGNLGASYVSACGDLAASARGLSDLVDQAAAMIAATDDAVAGRFAALRPI